MARGKHGHKAALRRETERKRALELERRRLAEEEKARAKLDADLAEMAALAEEIAGWRERLSALGEEEADALRAEVVELVREVAQLEQDARRRLVERDRRVGDNENMAGVGIQYFEDAIRETGGGNVVITAGVHEPSSKKLTLDQIKAIQRARGYRR